MKCLRGFSGSPLNGGWGRPTDFTPGTGEPIEAGGLGCIPVATTKEQGREEGGDSDSASQKGRLWPASVLLLVPIQVGSLRVGLVARLEFKNETILSTPSSACCLFFFFFF